MSTNATVLIMIAVTAPGAVAAGCPSSTSMTCTAAYNFVTQRGAVVIGTGGLSHQLEGARLAEVAEQ